MKKSEINFKCVLPTIGVRRYITSFFDIVPNLTWNFAICEKGNVRFIDSLVDFNDSPVPFMKWQDVIEILKTYEADSKRKFNIKLREEVLVTDDFSGKWELCEFSRIDSEENKFIAIGLGCGDNLIRYKNNKDLIGTTTVPEGWWEVENGEPVWRRKGML